MSSQSAVIHASVDRRATFISRTYLHLFFAVVAFVLLEVSLFQSGAAERIASVAFRMNWLLILGAFMLVSWFASRLAHSQGSVATQYAGLALFVVAEAMIFTPLLYAANRFAPGAISSAAQVTLVGFTGLTLIAFKTRKDFSFLRSFLMWIGLGALILIAASVLFGWHLGTWFSVGMVIFAGTAILYDTSKIIHHFPEDRYVGAALQLFASLALMFWYVLRLFMGGRN